MPVSRRVHRVHALYGTGISRIRPEMRLPRPDDFRSDRWWDGHAPEQLGTAEVEGLAVKGAAIETIGPPLVRGWRCTSGALVTGVTFEIDQPFEGLVEILRVLAAGSPTLGGDPLMRHAIEVAQDPDMATASPSDAICLIQVDPSLVPIFTTNHKDTAVEAPEGVNGDVVAGLVCRTHQPVRPRHITLSWPQPNMWTDTVVGVGSDVWVSCGSADLEARLLWCMVGQRGLRSHLAAITEDAETALAEVGTLHQGSQPDGKVHVWLAVETARLELALALVSGAIVLDGVIPPELAHCWRAGTKAASLPALADRATTLIDGLTREVTHAADTRRPRTIAQRVAELITGR